MEEIRIDCAHQSAEELALAKEHAQLVFRLNHTMPITKEYDNLLHKLFPGLGANSRVNTPLTVIRPHNVKIWNSVIIMNGCLMMSAGGITIDDDVQVIKAPFSLNMSSARCAISSAVPGRPAGH